MAEANPSENPHAWIYLLKNDVLYEELHERGLAVVGSKGFPNRGDMILNVPIGLI